MEKLLAYLNALSKADRQRFASNCGTTEGYLRKAASIRQTISADLCIKLAKACEGAFTCDDLRPDVDWQFVRESGGPSRFTASRSVR